MPKTLGVFRYAARRQKKIELPISVLGGVKERVKVLVEQARMGLKRPRHLLVDSSDLLLVACRCAYARPVSLHPKGEVVDLPEEAKLWMRLAVSLGSMFISSRTTLNVSFFSSSFNLSLPSTLASNSLIALNTSFCTCNAVSLFLVLSREEGAQPCEWGGRGST